MTSIKKLSIHNVALELVREKITMLKTLLEDNREGLVSDTKSTAGDKHETSRAMGHLEQEKLNAQFLEAEKLLSLLSSIDLERKIEKVQMGSIIETTMGSFYLSVGLGQIKVENETIYCISPQSPIGSILLSKEKGDNINWQNTTIQILNVY
jgi:transcription elongation GreA/GreB family factor